MSETATGRPSSGLELPRHTERPLSEIYDVALLDLDGVVYLGGAAVGGAIDALTEARRRGMRLAFVTNNASRTPSAIAAQLNRLGVPAEAAEVVTSAQAAARLLAERLPAGAPVLVVGGMGLRIAVRERGLRPVSTALDRPAAVVQGYGPDVDYSLLAEGGLAVRAGAWFVASNADLTLPTARGLQPGNGALVQVIATATGEQPVVAGKPEPPLHAEAVERTGAKRPLVVGDRLDTDIEGAVRAGADSLLVLTGVSQPADAVLAPARRRPSYLAHDLSGLLEPQPEVTTEGAGKFRCGGWTARLTDGSGSGGSGGRGGSGGSGGSGEPEGLDIDGSGAAIDGLRALCAAAWSAGPVSADSVLAAVARLPFSG
jgi:glycerol 3-phosphatase-2